MLNFRPANEELLKSSIGFIDILEPSMDSKILHNRDLIMDLMILCNFDFNSNWQLEYRASVNGFECSNYNYKCNNKQPLLKKGDPLIINTNTVKSYQNQNPLPSCP